MDLCHKINAKNWILHMNEMDGWMKGQEKKKEWKRKEITDIQGIHSHLKIEQIQFGL